MVIGWVLAGIGAVLVVVGLVMFWRGVTSRVNSINNARGINPVEPTSIQNELMKVLKRLFTIIFNRDSPPDQVQMAAGLFLIVLGVLFAIVALFPLALASSGGGGSGDTTPSSTSSVAPTPTTSP